MSRNKERLSFFRRYPLKQKPRTEKQVADETQYCPKVAAGIKDWNPRAQVRLQKMAISHIHRLAAICPPLRIYEPVFWSSIPSAPVWGFTYSDTLFHQNPDHSPAIGSQTKEA